MPVMISVPKIWNIILFYSGLNDVWNCYSPHLLGEAGGDPKEGGEEPHAAQADLLREAELVTELGQPPLAEIDNCYCYDDGVIDNSNLSGERGAG